MLANERHLARWDRRAVLKLGATTTAALGAATAFFPGLGLSSPIAAQRTDRVEPGAGQWKTWLLQTTTQLRLPPPPDSAAEIAAVRAAAGQRDAATLERIAFWDAGSAAYRWNEIALDLANVKNNLSASISTRAMALMNAAIYDGAVAAWAAKYAYNRPRPSDLDPSLTTVVTPPPSPSYPSEHAVAAAAAATVLAHLFPNEAERLPVSNLAMFHLPSSRRRC
jgi:hypothetical protein